MRPECPQCPADWNRTESVPLLGFEPVPLWDIPASGSSFDPIPTPVPAVGIPDALNTRCRDWI